MAHLAATIICLVLSATPASRAAPPTPAARRATATATTLLEPPDELPKAPVEIVLPSPAPKGVSASPSARPGPPPAASTPPRPPSQSPAPAPAPARPAAGGAMPSDAEILAAATGEITDARPGYALVQQKCGRCHPMEKAIEAGFAPDAWEPYVRRKLRRHGAGISPEQAGEIVRFLSTWSKQRTGQ